MNRYLKVESFEREEFALLLIENAVVELKRRVGQYQPFKIDTLGRPDFVFSDKTETSKKELGALKMAAQMAREGYSNFLWISGPGGDPNAPYPDTRITWLRVANVTPDDVWFDGNRAICSDIDGNKCVELAGCLIKDGGNMPGIPDNVEDLRGFVVGFKDNKVLERLANALVEMDEVWTGIKNGQDVENKKSMMEIASWVEVRFKKQMEGVKSERESVVVGAMIEREIQQRFGIQLMAGGAHGMSNSAALGQLSFGGSPFNMIFGMSQTVSSESMDSRLKKCEICGNHFIAKKKQCPKCKG